MRTLLTFILICTFSACDFSCKKKEQVIAPTFNADYSFEKIIQYEKFGSKIPGSTEHQKAGDWIVSEMKILGLEVLEQKTEATTFQGNKIPVRNIIARFNTKSKKRILLSAHWDNRPFSDQDPKDRKKPVPGVNDGGSGVVVLMGIAKALSEKSASVENIGVDFAFWDAEDWGNPSDAKSYCLGSQYWAEHPVPENYHALFGMNFDMIGRIGSVFPIENYSMEKGSFVYELLHQAAKKTGYQDFFPDYRIGPIVDDHYFVTEGRGFPMIDLIYMTPDGRFPPEWHTQQDTSEFISRDVLKAVGQTTIQMILDTE